MTTETINFRLGKQPFVKDKIIVLEEADGRKAVIFPMYRPKQDIEHAEVAKAGEMLELTGKWGTDKKTGKPQFYVDKAFNAKMQKEVIIPNEEDIEVAEIPFWERYYAELESQIQMSLMNFVPSASSYPAPLFDGDPYAINPEVDFNAACFAIGDKTIYTDGKMCWFKDNPAMRNKFLITPVLQEAYEKFLTQVNTLSII